MEERIGHYRIVSELGRGGMGVVYKAHEESLNRYVALKVLGEHLSEDESYVERFIREAQSAASLNHPNIVQVYAIAEHGNRHYFAMEFVSGTSIQGLIKSQGKMDPVAAARLILQAASGLGAAHELSIVHRDVKPANLMVDQRGLVKITDFGLALLAAGATRLTATGMFMGTPGYLSPEQCLDDNVDHRTDIYSLGVTLYEMLSGKVPFKADSPLALIRQITEVEPPDILDLNSEVPEPLAAVLRKMMAKNRNERYSDCDAVVQDLKAWLNEVGGSDESMGPILAAVSASAANAKTVIDSSQGKKTRDMTPTVQAFDDDPTVQVDSAAMADGAAEPPPPPPIAAPPQAPPPSDPEIVATADEVEQPAKGGGNKIALLAIAAVLLFAIAGATGLALYKFGVFSPSEQPTIAEVTETDSTASALVGQPGDGTPAEAANVDEEQPSDGLPLESLPEGVESESESGQTESSSTRGVAPTGASGGARTGADSGGSGGGGPNSTGTANVPPPAKAGTNPAAEARTQEPPAVRPQPRVGRGVAVIHLGEPLLAATASDYVTEALSRRGLEVFDGGGIPGVMDLIDNGPDGNGPNLAELVRPHARWLVVIRAEYTGDRPLTSIAGYDREFQSRLHVVAQDLMDGRPFGKGIHVPIGYTHLTVEKKVADTLRPRLRDAATRMAAIGN